MSESAGSVNVPVVAASAAVSPGNVIVADDDGVLVVPRDEAASVLEAIQQQRLDKESATRARFEAGELGVDSCGLRDTLSDLSVHCRDET